MENEKKSFEYIFKREIDMVDKMNHSSIPTRMFCQICGHIHRIDFWVPDNIWDAAIHPRYKDTHICLNCFMERADERLLPWDKEIKLFPCSMSTQIHIQNISSCYVRNKVGCACDTRCGYKDSLQ